MQDITEKADQPGAGSIKLPIRSASGKPCTLVVRRKSRPHGMARGIAVGDLLAESSRGPCYRIQPRRLFAVLRDVNRDLEPGDGRLPKRRRRGSPANQVCQAGKALAPLQVQCHSTHAAT